MVRPNSHNFHSIPAIQSEIRRKAAPLLRRGGDETRRRGSMARFPHKGSCRKGGTKKIRTVENADYEITGDVEGRRTFFYLTQSSTLPNDPSLFRALPGAVPPRSTSMIRSENSVAAPTKIRSFEIAATSSNDNSVRTCSNREE